MIRKVFTGLALVMACGGAAAWGDSWNRTDDLGRNPVTKVTQDKFSLGKAGRLEIHDIGGSVEVTGGTSDTVEYRYERRAATQEDFDCEQLHVEHDKDSARLWVERKHDRACRSIRATDRLAISLPRGYAVSLGNIGDSVRVTGLDGLLRLDSIGDSAMLRDIAQLDADGIGDRLRAEVSRLGPAGIKVDSVGDSVVLDLPDSLDARLQVGSVGDEVRVPGLRVESGDVEATFGKGGPLIRIDGVGDSVVIHGPQAGASSAPRHGHGYY